MNSRKTIGCGTTHGVACGLTSSKNGINCRAQTYSPLCVRSPTPMTHPETKASKHCQDAVPRHADRLGKESGKGEGDPARSENLAYYHSSRRIHQRQRVALRLLPKRRKASQMIGPHITSTRRRASEMKGGESLQIGPHITSNRSLDNERTP